ncbi:MAG: hypothetical protein J5I93_25160 [Pirellulaceae bacterium]|nr:hypothetical protein [Pirellulaceae bacterium]
MDLISRIGLDQRGWMIRDHWEADLCAIGISSRSCPSRLVYVSTFDRQIGHYDYECEQSTSDDGDDYVVVDGASNVEYSELLDAMERHLAVTV